MNYFEVIPATGSFHGKEALTYAHPAKLKIGQIVRIKLRGLSCQGIVVRQVSKPAFVAAEIEEVLSGLVIPEHQIQLLQQMSVFYPAPLGSIAQLFAPSPLTKPLVAIEASKLTVRGDFKSLPQLTTEQAHAYALINKSFAAGQGSFIVHGITGSGKTRLYIELAKDNLAKNQSVLVLTPEISLTAPIAESFKQVFGDRVLINHSALTPKQKSNLFYKLFFSKKPFIIVGPRSSLFLPLGDLGLIVVDEFHEPAYKQESRPFYHANRTASMLAKFSGAKLIFGSATPPVIDYYLAEQKNVPIIRLSRSAITSEAPENSAIIVNLLNPDENSGHPLISRTLIKQISETLSKGEQVMLFINKRGSARSISCQDCGHREVCKNCDLPMVYHGDQHLIRCHTCGYSKKAPAKCPICGSIKIFFSSPGTKAIAASLSSLFPKARIARFDRDNKKSEKLENRYEEAVNNVDIIVGTQVVTKGHDLPRLSLVSMLLADSSLDFPDFSSAERTYQLIKQLSGRINRGHRKGIFVVQTFNPESEFIRSAVNDSWEDFYRSEVVQRQKYGFPPFYSALKIESSRSSRTAAERSLENLIEKLALDSKNFQILGPSPSFVEKKTSKWHWQILVKAKNRSRLVDIARSIPSTFKSDIDPNNFL